MRLSPSERHLLEPVHEHVVADPLPREHDLFLSHASVDPQVIPLLHGVRWEQLASYSPLVTLRNGLRLDNHSVNEVAEMIASTLSS